MDHFGQRNFHLGAAHGPGHDAVAVDLLVERIQFVLQHAVALIQGLALGGNLRLDTLFLGGIDGVSELQLPGAQTQALHFVVDGADLPFLDMFDFFVNVQGAVDTPLQRRPDIVRRNRLARFAHFQWITVKIAPLPTLHHHDGLGIADITEEGAYHPGKVGAGYVAVALLDQTALDKLLLALQLETRGLQLVQGD